MPERSSKDLVEHLRGIHFTLIGVCVALILVIASSRQYKAATALREIQEILELKKLWSIRWVMWHGIKQEAPSSESGSYSEVDNVPGDFTGKPIDLSKIGKSTAWTLDPLLPPSEPGQGAWPLNAPNSFPVFRDTVFSASVLQDGVKGESVRSWKINRYWVQEHTNPDWSPESFPATLADFHRWWSVLYRQHYRAAFPRGLYQSGGRCFPMFPGSFSRVFDPHDGAAVNTTVDGLTLEAREHTLAYESTNRLFGFCSFPVSRFAFVDMSQQTLREHFPSWKTGTFEDSFADLYRAGHELEPLELEQVEKFVADEAAKGPETFDALGIKFPVQQMLIWGSLLLLGIQLYFYIFLNRLTQTASFDETSLDVPWIGTEPSQLGRLTFLLTAVALPCCTVFALAYNRFAYIAGSSSAGAWRLDSVINVIPAIVEAIMAAQMFRLSVKMRRVITR